MTFSLYFPNAHENECVDIKMEMIYSRTTSRQGAQAWLDRHVPLGTCPPPGCPFSSRSTEPLRVSLSFQPVPGCGEDLPRSRHPAGSHLNDKHAGTAVTALPGTPFQHSREPVCRPSQPERSPRDPLLPFPHPPRSVVLAPYELFRGAFCSPLTPLPLPLPLWALPPPPLLSGWPVTDAPKGPPCLQESRRLPVHSHGELVPEPQSRPPLLPARPAGPRGQALYTLA